MIKEMAVWLGVTLALSASSALAANQQIFAKFAQDPSRPNKNEFVNTTPISGYCATYPDQCAQYNMFSIRVPMGFKSNREIRPGDNVSIKVPASWHKATVYSKTSGQAETVEIRIVGVGSEYVVSSPVDQLTGAPTVRDGHNWLWSTSSWAFAPPPCQISGVGAYSPTRYRFFWKTPIEAACTKTAQYNIPSLSFETLDFAYELRTPNPLAMINGQYTGSLAYTVGFLGDFDFGPLMIADDRNLTFDFVLDVQHTLKVDLPPGGDKVALEPEGGWQQWIDGGRKPSRIYREQVFYVSTTSRFSIWMDCDGVRGTSLCKLRSPKGNVANVQVFLDLPDGIVNRNASPVRNERLYSGRWTAGGPYQTSRYIDRKPGTLRFELYEPDIDTLLLPGFTDTFSGNVTLMWDSDA
ncbi:MULTISPECIES: hypothetical protein [unclassified Pseudomonas]|jgi:hypothetical protein|uniref:hypothetical protein n=1 Tax=unclassified Pseudomonas TaxID=196821 RepID=UPI000A55FFBC|nr:MULTISPECIES: hypothetical protein [unclassified Pseudomonas]WPN48172.1 hypothetical protein QMK58_05755 [Pseudomonas sp. P8_241]